MERFKLPEELVIRSARIKDTPLILSFIRELADYEKLSHQVAATEAKLQDSLFSAEAAAHVLIAEYAEEPAGFAVYFFNYSTFLASPDSTWKTFMSARHCEGRESGAPCWSRWPGSPRSTSADAWSGRYWTGMNRPSAFIKISVRPLWRNGPCTG